jgi:hypothetical protein
VDVIERSIRENGWWGAVVAQVSTRRIIAGKHRAEAAVRVGVPITVDWRDVDDDEAERMMLDDNRASDLATYDTDRLGRALDSLHDDDLLASLYTEHERAAYGRRDVAPSTPRAGDYGNVGAAPTPGERREAYEESSVRTILLPLPQREYERVIANLRQLQAAMGVDSTGAVLLELLERADQ